MKRKIYIDGKHWDNIMALPCVRGLNKRGEGYVVKVKVGKASTVFAEAGDAIVEKDDGSWHVEKKGGHGASTSKVGAHAVPVLSSLDRDKQRSFMVPVPR